MEEAEVKDEDEEVNDEEEQGKEVDGGVGSEVGW